MTESQLIQMEVRQELSDLLTPPIIEKLGNALKIPARIMEENKNDPLDFLHALKEWKDFDSTKFDNALGHIDEFIRQKTKKLDWLSGASSRQSKPTGEEKSVKTFIELLTNEMTSKNWKILTDCTSNISPKGNVEAKEMIKLCIENNLITSGLSKFSNSLKSIKQTQLAAKVQSYAKAFESMSPVYFHELIKLELESEGKEDHEIWQLRLKKFIKKQNENVSVLLDQETESIETVYVPLTIVKVRAVKEKVGVESGISEIEFLRTMHDKVAHDTVEVVEFDEIVTACDPSESELWCMIGSPGSGKSFLCKHFAYLYGTYSLPNFRYAISIPCRSEEWHQLEEARHEGEKVVDEEFIIGWLMISMSTGAQWSKSLSQHLLRSDGEGLFIILDGADEFTRNVPFKETLLCKLLGRRFLSLSTILITSRPAAWSEILYQHSTEFHVGTNFQVLGFSPENRDLYFEKRIETPDKLTAVHEMFQLHDEINQLSLVPVNASLFSALFNQSHSILSQTLSHLYTQLIVYMIRRQLSRVGLKEQSAVETISGFHPAIRECIRAIGLEANQGIFDRELNSDKKIPLKIGDKFYRCERLGLMQSHMKVVSLINRVEVWTFQHLTIQEFMAALSICDNSWRNQCYIVRYFTTSTQYLAMYKMVIRFVCGVLRANAGCITPILCRHTLPKPMSFSEVPMLYQLDYDYSFVNVSDWKEFTQSYVLLTTVINETNSDTITDHFSYLKRQSPFPLYLYFKFTVSPNEWHCFLLSLKYIRHFQIILIQSGFVTATQFHSLLTRIPSCHIRYLALAFLRKDFDTIHSYTNHLSSATLPLDTRISISLELCNLSDCPPSQHLFTVTNRFVGSLQFYQSDMSPDMLREITNQFSSLEYLDYEPNQDSSHYSIIQQLALNHQFNGFYIHDYECVDTVIPAIVSRQFSLTELMVHQLGEPYDLVPSLRHLTSLKLLCLDSDQPLPTNDSLRNSLEQLISNNSNSLRELCLSNLHRVGFNSWSSYFSCVTPCTNLVVLSLYMIEFISDDSSCWFRAVSALKSLAYLLLRKVKLQDSGMLVVCSSLAYHPAIKCLWIVGCDLTSASCTPIVCLIQTLKYVRELYLNESELSSPEPEHYQLLKQTAEKCSVKIKFY